MGCSNLVVEFQNSRKYNEAMEINTKKHRWPSVGMAYRCSPKTFDTGFGQRAKHSDEELD